MEPVQAVVALALAAALALGPGLLTLGALRPQVGWVRNAALAPPISLGLFWVVATVLGLLRLPVSAGTVLPIAVAVPLVAFVVRRRRAPAASRGLPVDRWDIAGVATGMAISVVLWVSASQWLRLGVPNDDGSHHGFYTTRILVTSSLDPAQVLVGDVITGTPTYDFYPLALHLMAAMIAATGIPVAVALNATWITLSALGFRARHVRAGASDLPRRAPRCDRRGGARADPAAAPGDRAVLGRRSARRRHGAAARRRRRGRGKRPRRDHHPAADRGGRRAGSCRRRAVLHAHHRAARRRAAHPVPRVRRRARARRVARRPAAPARPGGARRQHRAGDGAGAGAVRPPPGRRPGGAHRLRAVPGPRPLRGDRAPGRLPRRPHHGGAPGAGRVARRRPRRRRTTSPARRLAVVRRRDRRDRAPAGVPVAGQRGADHAVVPGLRPSRLQPGLPRRDRGGLRRMVAGPRGARRAAAHHGAVRSARPRRRVGGRAAARGRAARGGRAAGVVRPRAPAPSPVSTAASPAGRWPAPMPAPRSPGWPTTPSRVSACSTSSPTAPRGCTPRSACSRSSARRWPPSRGSGATASTCSRMRPTTAPTRRCASSWRSGTCATRTSAGRLFPDHAPSSDPALTVEALVAGGWTIVFQQGDATCSPPRPP